MIERGFRNQLETANRLVTAEEEDTMPIAVKELDPNKPIEDGFRCLLLYARCAVILLAHEMDISPEDAREQIVNSFVE
jgi:hypothetical protein